MTEAAAYFFEADAASCMLWDQAQQNLVLRAGYGFKTDYATKQRIPYARLQSLIESGAEYLVTEDLRVTPYGESNLIEDEGLVSALSVFMRYAGNFFGAVNIYSRDHVRIFTQEEIENARLFAQQAAITARNAQLYGELLEEAQTAKTLLQVAEDVGSLDSLDEVLNRIVINLTRALCFRMCAIFLWDQERKFFMPVKAIGIPPHRHSLFQTLILRTEDLNFTETELSRRDLVFAMQAQGRFPMEKLGNVMMERDLCLAPLVTKGKLMGAIVCAGYQGKEEFDGKNETLLRGIAAQAAIAIDDANLFEALERAFWDIIKTLAAAIEVKDHYTHSHSQSVIFYGSALAKKMKLPKNELDLICKACLLHDVGKIGVDDAILRKVTPLTQVERRAIEMHPVIGAEILASVRSLQEISTIVRHHHENYNGTGYPDRLKGEEIPLLSRILQVADCYDAMTSDRPYRKALTRAQAVEQLKKFSGSQFDPKLVAVFLELVDDDGMKWDAMKDITAIK
jgi:putative nucleotidyltransferase with HDIG domain